MTLKYAKVISSIFAILIIGCSPKYNSLTPELRRELNGEFISGRANLDCTVSCTFSWMFARQEMISLYDSQKWQDLAEKVMEIGFKQDLAYYFLGRAAEGLGYKLSALVYYEKAKELYYTPGYNCYESGSCRGFDLSSMIPERIAGIQSINNPQKNQTASNITTASEEVKPNNPPLSNEEILELKSIFHAKNICEMCSWPMPNSKKIEIEKYLNYYKERTAGLLHLGYPLYEMYDGFAKGTVNGRGLVPYCTDPVERKRYDDVVASIKPFTKGKANQQKEHETTNSINKSRAKVDLSHIKKWLDNNKTPFDPIGGVRLLDDKNFKKALKSTIGKSRYDFMYAKEVQTNRYLMSNAVRTFDGNVVIDLGLSNHDKAFTSVLFVNTTGGFIDVLWGDGDAMYEEVKYKWLSHDGGETIIDKHDLIVNGNIDEFAIYKKYK